MSQLVIPMGAAISAMLPPVDFLVGNTEPNALNILAKRIALTNQMLQNFLADVQQDPELWYQVDTELLFKQFADSQKLITDTRPMFNDGSLELAQLDKMQHNIQQIKKTIPTIGQFDFDLERMKERVNDEFYTMPDNITNVDEFQSWLKAVANGN